MEHYDQLITYPTRARITPPDLATKYKDLVEYLVIRWIVAELPPEWYWEGERLPEPISYLLIDYRHNVGTLLLTTQDPDQTRLIFMSVMRQAERLGKTSFWVDEELKFEGMLCGTDRADFLRLDLEQTAHANNNVSDATLGQRVTRQQIRKPVTLPGLHQRLS